MAFQSLPPLHALRGFEAAARLLSFTQAADELHVTQGAISRQISDLETFLGFRLFERFVRRVELTEKGETYFRLVEGILGELERASLSLAREGAVEHHLHVSVLPTIASFWLMPRLHLFTEANPGVQVHFSSLIEPVNLQRGDIHVAIRVGRLPGRHYDRMQPRISLVMVEDWQGVRSDRLFDDVLVPVCAPSLLAGGPPIAGPADLLNYPLLHVSSRRHAWPDWMRAHGVRWPSQPQSNPAFGHFFMSIEAARNGRGIAIVPEVLLASYDFRHDLVRPLAQRMPSAGEYYLLIHEDRLDHPIVSVFREWMLSEAAAYEDAMAAERPAVMSAAALDLA